MLMLQMRLLAHLLLLLLLLVPVITFYYTVSQVWQVVSEIFVPKTIKI